MTGENFVSLIGKIVYPNLRTVGDKNNNLLNAKLAIPVQNADRFQYVKIACWGAMAESLNDLPTDTFVKIHGHIEERSYDGKCRHCGGYDKKFWTNVVVDNFVVIEEE